MDKIKEEEKNNLISEDEQKSISGDVQKITDEKIKTIVHSALFQISDIFTLRPLRKNRHKKRLLFILNPFMLLIREKC